jgi:hypothetical protein
VSPSPPGAARWLSPLSWALLALAALAGLPVALLTLLGR